ncbi:MAG: hypothetical protein V3U48_07775 [Rhodospirillales bacterium]
MTIIIGALALLVSLIALWLGSANLKKMENGSKEIKKQINNEMDIMKGELDKKITAITRTVKKFDSKLEIIIEGQSKAEETAKDLQKEVDKIRRELDGLLFRLPPKYRLPQSGEGKRDYG